MGTLDALATPASPPVPRARDAVPIASVQPGGGFCFGLERAWGRWRRAWLRTLRPGYVRRMAALRQGECPGCPHDIIDPRDLAPVRNVCGFRFAEADDAFRWRDRLGLARRGLAEIVCATLGCGALIAACAALAAWLGHWAPLLPAAALLVLWSQMVWFFRDPTRAIPDDPHALLAPADGRITDVEEVADPDFPGGRAFRVSIYLSPWDVHLNRMPRTARVVRTRYFPGEFVTARRADSIVRNEQLWVDLEEPDGRPVRVKQVSGALARRIVCWLRPGETVVAGERFGLIKYGSRTDVLVPADPAPEPAVRVGDRVQAGRTVLCRFPAARGPA